MPDPFPESSPVAHPHDDLSEYAPISIYAVVGLVLGAFSVVALIAPILWLVPVAGAAVCWVALSRTGQEDSLAIGRRAALFGLTLCVLFGVAAPARFMARQVILSQRARQFADAWTEHVRAGRLYQAHQLTVPPAVRMPLHESLADLYQNDAETQEAFRKFTEREPMNILVKHAQGLTFHAGSTTHLELHESDTFGQLLEVDFPPGSNPATVSVQLWIARTEDPETGAEQWQIRYVRPGGEPP